MVSVCERGDVAYILRVDSKKHATSIPACIQLDDQSILRLQM